MKEYLLASKTLSSSGNGIYNYCPYCLKNWKKQNQNNNASYKDFLTPLTYKRHLLISGIDKEGKEIKSIEETWECVRCGISLTTDDFVLAYCVRSDGKRYTEEDIRR